MGSAILLGCGLRAERQEKATIELKYLEDEQNRFKVQRQMHTEGLERMTTLLDYLKEWFDAQQQSYTVVLDQLQTDIATVTGEIEVLRKTAATVSQSQVKALAQFSKDVEERSKLSQAQLKESTKSICDSVLEQHTALRKLLEGQGKQSIDYYKFMIDQPWAKIKEFSETLCSIAGQVNSILSAVDAMESNTENQLKRALNKLKADSELLQEKLQYVCETMKAEGKESRDAMDRVMQGYSNVTAQDLEVLTALARDTKV